jgi:hypothetical protein
VKLELAEGLLGRVMAWDRARLAEELPLLDRMARFKYDEYQQFAPGRKFVETLGLWLHQFATPEEREAAYAFVKRRLVFISAQELRHLVEASFPDVIRPILIRRAAVELCLPPYRLSQVMTSAAYQRIQRASLFLGMSDGAHMDILRRSAGLDNEQVWQAYELSRTKSGGMLADLRRAVGNDGAWFERIFLIDDFSASGISYIRIEDDGSWKGKIVKAIEQFEANGEASALVGPDGYEMYIVLYVSTNDAIDHIRGQLERHLDGRRVTSLPTALAIYELPSGTALSDNAGADQPFLALVDDERYYRARALDPHESKGGTKTVKRGFAGCGLPVVLSHNCPNNSVYLLWTDGQESGSARGLFPRIVRHKDPS